MARKITFRGIDVEELKDLSMDEAMKYIPSNARRAVRRAQKNINYKYKKLMEKVSEAKKNNKKVKTHLRAGVILPSWIGMNISIYNGKQYVDLVISPEMIGHRLGEFAPSTGPVKHSGPGVGATRGSKFMPLK